MRLRSKSGLPPVLLALLLPLAGCGGDATTAPDTSGPNVVVIEDPSGAFGADTALIRALVDSTLARASRELPITGVRITVRPDADGAIDGWGVGGRTPDAVTVNIAIDPGYPGLTGMLPSRLPGMVAHELHHAIRWRNPGYGRTLLEAMVSEGLADRFAIELLGIDEPPWCTALTPDQGAAYLAQARIWFDAPTYDHDAWFFGTTKGIPRWTGYTLGYGMVLLYQSEHEGQSAAELVAEPADSFEPPAPPLVRSSHAK